MKNIIWKLRYAFYMHKHGADWPTCWYCAKVSIVDYGEHDPIEAAKSEMYYWGYD